MSWDAVLFDCDGVLVDSEPISNRILTEMLNDLGLPLSSEETLHHFLGRSMPMCMTIIEEKLGRPAPENFTEQFHLRTVEAFERHLELVPGIGAVLDSLPWPHCVASSGDHAKLHATLTKTGLYERFQGRIFSAGDVSRGKPHPDLFLYAAERMGAAPARCAVVEDSVLGVQAGVAAGMCVFGYAGTLGKRALQEAGAHETFEEMPALRGLLQRHQPVA
ncbi:MAG: HAD family hydrolase [Gemmatimonadetes bacterium]|nr:HAD family hydrolase [Gemmatimonadota bacterium]